MRVSDIAQVMEVEQQSFPTMWPSTAFKRELEQNRLSRYLVACLRRSGAAATPEAGFSRLLESVRGVVTGNGELPPPEERDELVVGFVGVWLLADEAHIVTIAVRDGHRRRGIGELLLIGSIETALRGGQTVVTLECRVSNDAALRLYDKYAFERVGLRPRYYSDNHEDAYILTARAIETASFGRRIGRLRQDHRERCGEYSLEI